MSATVMPEDWEPTRRGSGSNGGGSAELIAAAAEARAHPGRWVQVGEAREMAKPPTSWVSEVNRGEKASLNGPGERWFATYEFGGDYGFHRGHRIYSKFIKVVLDGANPEVFE